MRLHTYKPDFFIQIRSETNKKKNWNQKNQKFTPFLKGDFRFFGLALRFGVTRIILSTKRGAKREGIRQIPF